ncbi:MAG: 3-hydroxyacyl-CoA dehydrogenase NAD-binding domain-containing protein [Anaerolineae bacterium]
MIEAAPERLALKQEIFGALEAIVASDAILATNTSTLSVAAIGGPLAHPERLLGLHFFNPAPLMPLVEVIRGPATDAAVVDVVVPPRAAGVRRRCWPMTRPASS